MTAQAVTGSISQSGALTVTGVTNLTVSSSDDVVLQQTTNNFKGAVTVTGATNVTLGNATDFTLNVANKGITSVSVSGDATVASSAATGLKLGNSAIGGSLNASSSAGDLVDSGVVTVGGTASFSTTTANSDITLDQTTVNGSVAFNTAGTTGNASFNTSGGISLAASDVVPVTSNLPDWLMTPPVERTKFPEAEEGPAIPRAFVSVNVTLAPLNVTFAKLLFKGRLMLPVAVSVASPDGASVAVPDWLMLVPMIVNVVEPTGPAVRLTLPLAVRVRAPNDPVLKPRVSVSPVRFRRPVLLVGTTPVSVAAPPKDMMPCIFVANVEPLRERPEAKASVSESLSPRINAFVFWNEA